MEFKFKGNGTIPQVTDKLYEVTRKYTSEHQDDITATRNVAQAAINQMAILASESSKEPKDIQVDLTISCTIGLTTKEKTRWLGALTPSR